jgi:hypothetical protein
MIACRSHLINAQAGNFGQHELEPHDRPAPLFEELLAILRIAGQLLFPDPMAFGGIPVCHGAGVRIHLLLGRYPVSEAGQAIGQPVAPVILTEPVVLIVGREHDVECGRLFAIDYLHFFRADEVIDSFGDGGGGVIGEPGILNSDTEADSTEAIKTDKVRKTINR